MIIIGDQQYRASQLEKCMRAISRATGYEVRIGCNQSGFYACVPAAMLGISSQGHSAFSALEGMIVTAPSWFSKFGIKYTR